MKRIFTIILLLCSLNVFSQITYYVKPTGNDIAGGTSWSTAFKTVQKALQTAAAGNQVWIAAGTYYPDEGPSFTDNDRTASFALKNDVDLYGGFPATGNPGFSSRNLATYKTTLSGDLQKNDGANFANNADNAYHVVKADGVNRATVLNGFTISGGNANGSVSSFYDRGGGIYNNNSSPSLANCTFTGNSAINGGAIYNANTSLALITYCTFTGNSATNGGAMGNGTSASVTLANCSFSDNNATSYGGAIYNYNASPTITDCSFSNNHANAGGGILNHQASCKPIITNCIFSDNVAPDGGGMYNHNSSAATVTNCRFEGNKATANGGGMVNTNNSTAYIIDCIFIQNEANKGGGMFNNSLATITSCNFSLNKSSNAGGGMYNNLPATTTNSLFIQNESYQGGGMYNNASATAINCSFTLNKGTNVGGGIYNGSSSPVIANCILWNDINGEVENSSTSTPLVTYSIVGMSTGVYPGDGNKNEDPRFTNAAGGDLHLQGGSLAIDAGRNDSIPAGVTTDIDGFPRIYNNNVDMGPYEYMPCPEGDILYVSQDATNPVHDGTSWDHAFNRLQDALARTSICTGVTQIWVAAGRYYSDEGPGIVADDRMASFMLKNGIAIYGGFDVADIKLSDRDPVTNITILSGDLKQNDAPGFINITDNAYHVVKADGVNATAILDGFTITGGHANGGSPDNQGGGLFGYSASPTITACLFTANRASGYGGGMANASTSGAVSSPTITGCHFKGNYGPTGGGMDNYYSNPTITACTFEENTSTTGGGGVYNNYSLPVITNCDFLKNTAEGYGAGIVNAYGSDATITGCHFTENKTSNTSGGSANGGGIENFRSSPTITNCTFEKNVATNGGGVYNTDLSAPTLEGCSFEANTASNGGGMFNTGSSPTLTNCSFSKNIAPNGGGMYNTASSTPTLTTCSFSENGATSYGGGMYNTLSSPTLTGCSFSKNKAPNGAGMDNYDHASPIMTNCTFTENVATVDGGGVFNAKASTPVLTNCTFTGNSASGYGGAVNNNGSSPTLTNCSFYNNHAANGAGMNNFSNSASTLINCSFSGNTASQHGKGIYNTSSSPIITNCILWGNTAEGGGGDIYNSNDLSKPEVKSYIVEGGYSGGTNILNKDPLFKDVATGDLSLEVCSPAVNTGLNSANTTLKDLAGNDRIFSGIPDPDIIDMGAYELQAEGTGTVKLSTIKADRYSLAPPNHKLQTLTLDYSVTGGCAPKTTVTVTSNEPVNGTGDGDTEPDWNVVDNTHVQLRAERAALGDGRVYTIYVTTTDLSGTFIDSTKVHVSHNITAPPSGAPFKLGAAVDFAGTFWDRAGNRHTAKWLIDDNTTVKGTVTEPSGTKNGKVTGSYRFNSAGVYKLQMNVTDQSGVTTYANTAGDLEAIVVVYNPLGGYIYGGGYYNSPAGSVTSNPRASGKASYGFSLNYFKGAILPKGETQFEFKVGELEFNALTFDYLVISGARAQFRGTGKIIGDQSGINFIMTAIDGALDGTGVDKVRMKIFNKNTGYIYYDSEPGLSEADNPKTPVGFNSTVVIGGTQEPASKVAQTVLEPELANLQLRALPNPTRNDFNVFVQGNKESRIRLQVFDQWGRQIEQRFITSDLTHLGATYRPGVYYIRVVQGDEHREVKVMKLPQ